MLPEGPFDTPPADRIDPEMVEVVPAGGAVRVRVIAAVRLAAVGELLYVMLAGGPLRLGKDAPDRKPRPLGKLRTFLGGGPLPPGLEPFVLALLEERFPTPESALDSLDHLGVG